MGHLHVCGLVAKQAEPANLKRFGVIVMVGVQPHRSAASLARRSAGQSASAKGSLDSAMNTILVAVLFAPAPLGHLKFGTIAPAPFGLTLPYGLSVAFSASTSPFPPRISP